MQYRLLQIARIFCDCPEPVCMDMDRQTTHTHFQHLCVLCASGECAFWDLRAPVSPLNILAVTVYFVIFAQILFFFFCCSFASSSSFLHSEYIHVIIYTYFPLVAVVSFLSECVCVKRRVKFPSRRACSWHRLSSYTLHAVSMFVFFFFIFIIIFFFYVFLFSSFCFESFVFYSVRISSAVCRRSVVRFAKRSVISSARVHIPRRPLLLSRR